MAGANPSEGCLPCSTRPLSISLLKLTPERLQRARCQNLATNATNSDLSTPAVQRKRTRKAPNRLVLDSAAVNMDMRVARLKSLTEHHSTCSKKIGARAMRVGGSGVHTVKHRQRRIEPGNKVKRPDKQRSRLESESALSQAEIPVKQDGTEDESSQSEDEQESGSGPGDSMSQEAGAVKQPHTTPKSHPPAGPVGVEKANSSGHRSGGVRTRLPFIPPRSPPKTRQSTVAGRVRRQARKLGPASRFAAVRRVQIKNSRPLVLGGRSRKRRRVISASFLSGSDCGSEGEGALKRGEGEKRKRRGKPRAKRRRRLSSGGEEQAAGQAEVSSVAVQHSLETVPEIPTVAVPSRLEPRPAAGGGEEGWTCTSDEDDLAVSKRLEELQRERRGNVFVSERGERVPVEVLPLTCSAPSKILYVYQPNMEGDVGSVGVDGCGRGGGGGGVYQPNMEGDVGSVGVDGCRRGGGGGGGGVYQPNMEVDVGSVGVDGCGTGGGGGGGVYQPNVEVDVGSVGVDGCGTGGGGRGCVNVANLEINPGSIITDSECATQPGEDSQTELFDILKSESNSASWKPGNRRRQFGVARRYQRATQTRTRRAAVLASTSCSSPEENMKTKELTQSRKARETEEQKPKRKRGRPRKSSLERRERQRKPGSERNTGQGNSGSEPKRPRGRPRKKDGWKPGSERNTGQGNSGSEPKRPRGRPRKKDGWKPGSERNTGQGNSGSEPKRPRGRPRKKDGWKPPSLPVRRDSGSPPQSSPQNGEDSGYPGSISSSSSQGPKSLKSQHDISPIYNFPTDFPSSATAVDKNEASSRVLHPPLLEQQCRGSVNTAELGLFSPELLDDTHIPNFPMPPDPQWVWPAMGIVEVGTRHDELLGSHTGVGGGLDSASETTTQSLFDPSKMVIAKVESLSDDSRFNDYLNEILESEEVIECLNSISSEPPPIVVEPPPITPLPAQEGPSGYQVTVLAGGGGGVPGEGLESTNTPSNVAVTTSLTSLIESSQTNVVSVCAGEQSGSSSETVAAYVAAETSAIPFSIAIGDCFATPAVEVVTTTAARLTGLAQENLLSSRSNLITVPSTLSSLQRGGVAPKSNVMWSQSDAVEEPDSRLKPPEANTPLPELKVQQSSTSGSSVHQSSDGSLLQQPVSQSTTQAVSTASSSGANFTPDAPPAELPQGERRVFRLKRRNNKADVNKALGKAVNESSKSERKAVKTEDDSSKNGGKKTAASLKARGKDPDKEEEEETVKVSKPSEVKSRTGRAIKPSWKVAQQTTATLGLKRTNSPGTKSSVSSKSNGGEDKRASGKCGKLIKTRIVKTSVATSGSLAEVVGNDLKKLPDIPVNTLRSLNPTVAFPSAPGSLSMSLDEILVQMNDDESQEESRASEFAESLLNRSGAGSYNDSRGEMCDESKNREKFDEKVTEVPLREDKVKCSERAESGVPVKPARMFPSPIRWTEEDNASLVPPQTATQHREPPQGISSDSSTAVVDIHDQSQSKTQRETLELTGMGESAQQSTTTVSRDLPPELPPEPDEEDDCCAVMMDLASSTDEEGEPLVIIPEPRTPLVLPLEEEEERETLSLPDPRTPSLPPEEMSGETLSLTGPRTPSLPPPQEDIAGPNTPSPPPSEVDSEALSLAGSPTLSPSPLEVNGETLGKEGGEEEEDQIDVFADDIDAFTVYTMEEKAKNATPPRMPSPPRLTFPGPKVPTKPSVRNWIHAQNQARRLSADSQRQRNCFSFPSTPSHPQRSFSATPLPPSFPPPPPFPQHSHHSQPNQGLLPPPPPPPPPLHCDASGGGFNRHSSLPSSAPIKPLFLPCRHFLRGHCSYNPCRFSHAPLSSYPLSQLESILMHLPPEAVPMDISEHYVTRATVTPQSWFPQLVKLIRGLANRSWDAATQAYTMLSGKGVLLRPRVLSRLLSLMREQSQQMLSAFVPLSQLARGVLQGIRDQGPCNPEDYYSVLWILNTAQLPDQLMEVYISMRGEGHKMSREILYLMLRGSSPTDERILQLLSDSKNSLSVTNDIARIANGVLEKVGPQLVSRNLALVEEWLSGASDILDIMGKDSLLKLFNVLVSGQRWPSLLAMLEGSPKTVLSLESCVCGPLSEILLRQPTLTDRAIHVLEMMSDEALASFPPEGWNAVLTQCVLPATPQRATKFCRVLSRSKKCLDGEALDAVCEMSVSQNQSSPATDIVTTHLHFVPPVVPSHGVLGKLCTLLHQEGRHQDLFTVVERLLQCRVTPSLPVLQPFLDSCSREGSYSRLATVVKRARECGLRMEKIFYQRALVLLRPWGQDQAAISDIYKAIRSIDTGGPSISTLTKLVSSGALVQSQVANECGGTSTPASQMSRSSGGPTISSGRSGKSTKSLEYIYEQTTEPSPAVKPGILALLESNGRQGQFGAAVSILRNLRDTSSPTYCNTIVRAMWSAVTNSNHKPPNAFSSLLEQLAGSASSSEDLPLCDRWLASQLGIALLKMYAETQHWKSGFVILHHFHRHNIDYFACRKPIALLPPLKPPHPSLFGLARMAVGTCLRVDSPDFAVQVMKECQWASECSPGERQGREQLVVTVAERCLDSALYEDCYSCLQALDDLSTKNKRFTSVAQLYNRLLASVLDRSKANVDLGSRVYHTMNGGNFPCLPSNLSLLLGKLCDLLQFSTAREICEQAIDQNFYSPITHGELFSVFLPPSIHHIEVCSLIKRHLHRLSGELEGKLLQPLTITFEGSRDNVKEGLTKGFTPPLTPVFTSSSDSTTNATVSPSHLFNWLHKHFPSSGFLLEREEGAHRSHQRGAHATQKEASVSRGTVKKSQKEASVSRGAVKKSQEEVSVSRGTVKQSQKEAPVSWGAVKKSQEEAHVSRGAVKQSQKEAPVRWGAVKKSQEEAHVSRGAVKKSQKEASVSWGAVKKSQKEAHMGEGEGHRSQGGPSTATASTTEERREPEPADSDNVAPNKPASTATQSKQRFRVDLCRSVVAEVKPFYQAKRFKSYEDYLHLVKMLTTHLSKTIKWNDSAKSTLDDAHRNAVKALVESVMSQFTIYSPESNLHLGLNSS